MNFLIIALLLSLAAANKNDAIVNQEYLEGYNKFVNDLYGEITKTTPGSFVVSPLSVNIILALAEYGSKGETSRQLVKGLNLPQNKQKLRDAMTSLTGKLNTNASYTLATANKVYVKEGYTLNENFKKFAVDVYNSEIENIDFLKKEDAVAKINKWVEDKTVEKIKQLVNKDDLNEDTRAVLINALYFSGEWVKSFNKHNTKKETFYIDNNAKTEVNQMQIVGNYLYYENQELNAKFLELPFVGQDVTLTIVLPNEKDGLANLESKLKQVLEFSHYRYEHVNVKIPKDRIESKIELKPILQNLGIINAFEDIAEFPEITGERLKIAKVLQKSEIDINEDGASAAAATAVFTELIRSSIEYPKEPKQFIADHPFIYALKFRSVVLFIGHYIAK